MSPSSIDKAVTVENLIKLGAEIEAVDKNGFSSVIISNIETLDVLLEAGGNPFVKSEGKLLVDITKGDISKENSIAKY